MEQSSQLLQDLTNACDGERPSHSAAVCLRRRPRGSLWSFGGLVTFRTCCRSQSFSAHSVSFFNLLRT
eukprot:49330-Eustigmatos_ZCMA.PRE.1